MKKKPRSKAVALVRGAPPPAAPALVERVIALERKLGSLIADQDSEIAKLRGAIAEISKDRDTWRMKCEYLQGQLGQRLFNPHLRYYNP